MDVGAKVGQGRRMMRFIRGWVLLGLIVVSALTVRAEVTLETGEIAGAKFTIARPEHWNGKLLLLAHGLRDEDRPLLADLYPEHAAYKAMLAEGWIVAKTSYRRNGIIVADAITDLDLLRDYIAKKDGAPKRVILEGESMGGLIVTLLAERDPEHYAGAVAIGAALKILEKGVIVPVSGRPKAPLIYLTNVSELDEPADYVKAAAQSGEVAPVLFRVARSGHVNVNQTERLLALRALNAWLDHRRASLPAPAKGQAWFDATVTPPAQPSLVTLQHDFKGFATKVTDVSQAYGNVAIEAQPADFAAAGIKPGTWFELRTEKGSFRVFYGKDFSSVKKGEWVVFGNADGFFWLARNYDDAGATAGVKAGDVVVMRQASK